MALKEAEIDAIVDWVAKPNNSSKTPEGVGFPASTQPTPIDASLPYFSAIHRRVRL